MKKTLYNLFLCLMFLPFVSCESEDIGQHLKDTDIITLKLYTSTPVSRVMVDELYEYALSHLDVFIFNDGSTDDEKTLVHYERIKTNVSPEGEVNLTGKRRNEFSTGQYWVYVIANSKEESSSFKKDNDSDTKYIETLADLKAMTQEDPLLHLTATSALNAPQYFLMDGIAFIGENEPQEASAVVLNNGIAADKTELNVKLNRAAAKVVVKLTSGDKVSFRPNKNEGYYLRNLPTKTTLLADALIGDKQALVNTTKTVSAYSEFTEEVTVIAYVYKHSWTANELATKGTSLVLNIPLIYNENPNDDEVKDSYYQIELGKGGGRFERNNYYLITGEINAPGATEDITPVTLDNLRYQVLDWTSQTLQVGGEEKPIYLKVNKDILRIYNQDVDESLVFSSSSPITITVHGEVSESNDGNLTGTGKPYYYDKFALKKELENGKNNYNYWELNSSNEGEGNGVNITASSLTNQAMSGNIKVNSTIPNNNAIRYFYLLIRNEDGLTEKVFVEQYPVIYITNVQGYYSYRDDFGNDYTNRKSPYYTNCYWSNSRWSYNKGLTYSNQTNGFFRSKIAELTESGKSNLYYYFWDSRNRLYDHNNIYGNNSNLYKDDKDGNARMYHIHVTATSSEYTVGRPRMNKDGYTDNSPDNAKLVSPSFMIASQLGATSSTQTSGFDYNKAKTHCYNYVETYKDDKGNILEFKDWRLPTEAEIKIIVDHQYDSYAMDEVLAGWNYYSASGFVTNTESKDPDNQKSNLYLRCVRDAY